MLGGKKKTKQNKTEQLFLLLETKTNQLRRVLWWAECAAGCMGWVPPRPWQGKGGRILQVQTQLGAEWEHQQSRCSILNNPKFCFPFWCKDPADRVGKDFFSSLNKGNGEGKQFSAGLQHACSPELFCACLLKTDVLCLGASEPLADIDHVMCWRSLMGKQESTYLVVKTHPLSICKSIFLPAINYICLMWYLIVL